MLKPFYCHIQMSVNKIRIYPDICFSVLISWVEAGYNSQLVRPSELGSSLAAVAAALSAIMSLVIRPMHVPGTTNVVGWGEEKHHRIQSDDPSWHLVIHYTPILSVAVSGDMVQWTAITFKWLTVHLKWQQQSGCWSSNIRVECRTVQPGEG